MFTVLRKLASKLLEGDFVTGEAMEITPDTNLFGLGFDPQEVLKMRGHVQHGHYLFMQDGKESVTVVPRDQFKKYFTFTETERPGDFTPCKQTTSFWM